MLNFLDVLKPYGHWFLRVGLAAIFLYHGLTKFPVAESMAVMMDLPLVLVYLLATMETIGGILILVGGMGMELATKLAGAIFTIVMAGAIT
ncbi:MAG: DoxX family membrane protein, partial [Candidatus Margulisbacteria bacterium]|nr:DoxX family membrane protein [Candidatus Margulisiibacteriota bacterium]